MPISVPYLQPDCQKVQTTIARNHFCPIVPPHIATQNRRKRKRLNYFKALAQQASETDLSLYSLQDMFESVKEYTNFLKDRYGLPAASELAALVIGDASIGATEFDIIVECHSGEFKQIHPIHPALMALQYPLLFPYGEPSYHLGIKYKQIDDQPLTGRQAITMLEYFTYYAHYRKYVPNPYTCCGRLSDQASVNAYSCVESERLTYHFFHQAELRSETYQGITEAINKGASRGKDVGIKRTLPSSFIGSKRYLIQNYHDCMAICRVYGAPQLFITQTCNSNWLEIIEGIKYESGQKPHDRNDIIVRVFHLKLHELLNDLKDGSTFGSALAVVHTNEFQKRGLPHSHILTWLTHDKFEYLPSSIDHHVCAEIPNKEIDPLGYYLVEEFMIHGPCGKHNPNAPCMKNGVCSKRFPKQYRQETIIDQDGFVIYRRRDDGRTVTRIGIQLDNRWVVPYNMILLKKYQAHINVEVCNRTNLIKYLFKYVMKGPDYACVSLIN
ncbi:uncharacterized protein LOC133907870 isoform X4 [Phragmites australis]|uniref:uncharacterized protein LOC133907870 isoform X4 n=1 Tax=Phragmites australis TaxID=29695 RepID=UPI002D792F58|nr:uncharacterized protein LOC133907870 isoform X4 [Phragmites australis]